MKRTLVTFATPHYQRSRVALAETAAPYFDVVRQFTQDDLPAAFRQRYREHLRYRRGFGFWVWKPWLILRELMEGNDGDVVMYLDSQYLFVADPAPLWDCCERVGGALTFHQRAVGWTNRQWTKRDMYIRLACDRPEYWDAVQLNCGQYVFRVGRQAVRFAAEWLASMSDLNVIDDTPSTLGPELPGKKKDHRHDQSVASLVALAMGLESMPDLSEYGAGYKQPGRNYPQIIRYARSVSHDYPIPDLVPLPEPMLA
jgi:hypothetical protein